MKIEKIYNETLNETLYKHVHKSGLTIYALPKKNHTKSYAAFAAKYGSLITEFKTDSDSEVTKIPDGVAHFLEHKLFEQPDGTDAFLQYAKTGANANAYTGFNNTVYLYSCTDKFYENMEILLGFVSQPYFTEENIAKEQGIIGQEIRMYDDDPSWRVFFNMLDAMYVDFTIKKDIAGTVESIAQINKEILYKCYNTFYNPGNMILFTCGNVDIERVIETADKYIKGNDIGDVKCFFPKEPKHINKSEITQKLSVSRPLFAIGFKDTDTGYDGAALLKKDIVTSILLEMISGEGSPLYNRLYDSGLINDSFGSEYEGEPNYGFSSFLGESPDPHKVRDEILKEFSTLTLSEADFERAKKAEYGGFLRLWNSVENLSNSMVADLFKNINIFDFENVYESITFSDVKARFESHFKAENCVLSVIEPY